MLTFDIMLERMMMALFLSLIFGLERQIRKKPVGFGTFAFVSIGSCTLTLIALVYGNGNPLPLISGIITGIGFLGAGALIKHQDKVFGATTAASIWAVAAGGVAIGLGLTAMGIVFYLMIFCIIIIDYLFEMIGFGHYNTELILTVEDPAVISELWTYFPKGSKCQHYTIDNDKKEYKYYFIVSATRKRILKFLYKLRKVKGVKAIHFE